MEKQLVEYSLEDGTTFLVEVEESDTVAVDRVALPSGRMVAQAKETFEQALDHVKPVAAAVVSKLKDLGPHETEIKFGLKLTADAGAIFTSIGGEVNFEITVKWSKEELTEPMSLDNYRQTFKSAIARIYHTNGVVVGAGFLVGDRLLLTCAHVVTAALGIPVNTLEAPTDAIDVDFPLIAPDLKIKARVVFWSAVDPLQKKIGEDIAGLVLESQPSHSIPVRLVQGDSVWNHPFHIFGFPSQRDAGIWASGVLRDRLANGWVQMEDVKAEGYAVEPGFSGAPVWDEQLDGVVGMAIAAERKRTDAKAAFMIPVSVLSSTWADLAQRVVGSQPQACGSSTLPSFRQVKLKAKQEYLSVQMKKYEAAYNQLSYTLSQAEAVAIRRHVQTLEQEIIQIEQEIQELINL